MPANLELDRLRIELANCPTDAYLLSVTAEHRPHCGVVTVSWDESGTRLLVQAPSSWPGSAAAGLSTVTLLWSPATQGGYSLIVDGTAEAVSEAVLAVTVTRAVWHRRGAPTSPGSSTCGSDCKPILGKGATVPA